MPKFFQGMRRFGRRRQGGEDGPNPKQPTAEIAEAVGPDSAAICAALGAQGCVVVREALSKGFVDSYAGKIEAFFEALTKMMAEDRLPVDPLSDNFRKHHAVNLGFRVDKLFPTPKGYRDIYDELKERLLINCVEDYFSEPIGFLIDSNSIRRQDPLAPTDTRLRFHQDGRALAVPSADYCGVVFWIPLIPIDAETPSLEVINLRFDRLLEHAGNPATLFTEAVDPEALERRYRRHVKPLPDLRLGDIFIFEFTTVHRTRMPSGSEKPRISMDLRACPIRMKPPSYKGALYLP